MRSAMTITCITSDPSHPYRAPPSSRRLNEISRGPSAKDDRWDSIRPVIVGGGVWMRSRQGGRRCMKRAARRDEGRFGYSGMDPVREKHVDPRLLEVDPEGGAVESPVPHGVVGEHPPNGVRIHGAHEPDGPGRAASVTTEQRVEVDGGQADAGRIEHRDRDRGDIFGDTEQP